MTYRFEARWRRWFGMQDHPLVSRIPLMRRVYRELDIALMRYVWSRK